MRHDRDQRRALHAREQRQAVAGETVTIIRHPEVPVAHRVAQERAERDRTALAPRPAALGASAPPTDTRTPPSIGSARSADTIDVVSATRDDAEGRDGGVLAEDAVRRTGSRAPGDAVNHSRIEEREASRTADAPSVIPAAA